MKPLFRIKICGITNPADARDAVELGADAVGLNFYNRSLRCVPPDAAAAICQQLPEGVCKIGVFVNHSAADIVETANRYGLDAVQLHGDERPEIMADLRGTHVIRAIRLGQEATLESVLDEMNRWSGAGVAIFILDAEVGNQTYGGSGQTIDWNLAQSVCRVSPGPVILAGGLTPTNIAAAIRTVQPSGVDVASGVETFPGKKSAELLGDFVRQAKAALNLPTT